MEIVSRGWALILSVVFVEDGNVGRIESVS